ncbi:large subunit ribosomal protein L29 [Halohasta litchfieldiae]|jgi:large subunit ribosomal protein L29|uniref:Large ribosomal subunit protein uL29 n=1 Tax=Halohasta litchfieldiae TaxID=1073996 RepID=A0A1H6X3H7_9EURY|nr:50S ribosomal protein L29 [Halohasta litchfieldiae]ATW90082.1 large subunit ribosomal protein L29 [Halohasta litchfieldiae]SEJ21117.1 large subunit ribosomal protein L29 [Halohasta litchfieldiae]
MAILHVEEMRDMTTAEREVELEELETELLNLKALQAAGGVPENPSELKELRRTIARLKTVQNEEGDFESEAAASDDDE